MKLVMYDLGDQLHSSRPGILINQGVLDIIGILRTGGNNFPEYGTLLDLIELGTEALDLLKVVQKDLDINTGPHFFPEDVINLRAPLRDTRKLILLAGNYVEHIREVGFRIPHSGEIITPQFFMKPPSTTIVGNGDPVRLTKNNIWADWEVELAVVISKKGKWIKEEDALDYVYGYTILNDISEREFNSGIDNRFDREKDPFFDWLHGKWFDSFAPMGPCIVTKDSIDDPINLKLILKHNGKIEQRGSTGDMLHPISFIIHKLSEIMTIEPGDVISTGTPSGVGYSKGIKLKKGDELVCEIEQIGELWNPVV